MALHTQSRVYSDRGACARPRHIGFYRNKCAAASDNNNNTIIFVVNAYMLCAAGDCSGQFLKNPLFTVIWFALFAHRQ